MVAEHRLDEERFAKVALKLSKMRKSYFLNPAERTGTHALATSGGQLFITKRHLQCTRVEDAFLDSAVVGGKSAIKRWTSIVLRTKSVSILIIVLYLRTGEELSEANSAILQ